MAEWGAVSKYYNRCIICGRWVLPGTTYWLCTECWQQYPEYRDSKKWEPWLREQRRQEERRRRVRKSHGEQAQRFVTTSILYKNAPKEDRWGERDLLGAPGLHDDRASQQENVRDSLWRLSPDDQRVLRLRFYEDRTYKELAAALDVSLSTARRREGVALIRLAYQECLGATEAFEASAGRLAERYDLNDFWKLVPKRGKNDP